MNRAFEVYLNGESVAKPGFRSSRLVTVQVTYHPAAKKQSEPPLSVTVDGQEWEDDSYRELRWFEAELSTGDEVSVRLLDEGSDEVPILEREIEPTEDSCSFCGKSKSQVSLLIKGQMFVTFICDECVRVCMNEVIKEDQPPP